MTQCGNEIQTKSVVLKRKMKTENKEKQQPKDKETIHSRRKNMTWLNINIFKYSTNNKQ